MQSGENFGLNIKTEHFQKKKKLLNHWTKRSHWEKESPFRHSVQSRHYHTNLFVLSFSYDNPLISDSFQCFCLNSRPNPCKSQWTHSEKVIVVFVFARVFYFPRGLNVYKASVSYNSLPGMPSMLAAYWMCVSVCVWVCDFVGFKSHGKLWAFIIKGSPSWLLLLQFVS